jgi:hypothetical protein
VVKWVDYDETMEEFAEYVHVHLDKAAGDAEVYLGNTMVFLAENLEKI